MMKFKLPLLLVGLAVTGFNATTPLDSHADVLCQKGSKVSRYSGSTCPRRWRLIINTSSFQGPAGANGTNGTNGADGADGSLRIYGDGSDGALNITSDTTLSDPLKQYTNITIASGATLFVPSGTTLRCTGTLTNDGAISVSTAAHGGSSESAQGAAPTTLTKRATRQAMIGIAAAPPQEGEYGPNSVDLFGGLGGVPLPTNALKTQLNPGPFGGSGGGISRGVGGGGIGGGSLRVLCRTGIVNSGSILAVGDSASSSGGGGGGGGVVILASPGTITQTGTISVAGGAGGSSSAVAGPGGGGGGGLIHMISPVINSSGTLTVSGGAVGSAGTTVSNSIRSGGSGGGASAGNGGNGGDVSSANSVSGHTGGFAGNSFTTLTDPTGLF